MENTTEQDFYMKFFKEEELKQEEKNIKEIEYKNKNKDINEIEEDIKPFDFSINENR